MRSHVILALFAAGCGRVAFDERTDAPIGPIGHDEDGDGVGDADDVCPHLAGSQDDADGDGVGDDCDFAPMSPTERIALFVTFEGGAHPFTTSGAGTLIPQSDALRFTGVDNQLAVTLPAFASARVAGGADILAITAPANEQIQLYLSVGSDMQPHDYVELNQVGGAFQRASITRYDGSTYVPLQTQPLAQGIHPGSVLVQGTWLAAGSLAFDAGWPGDLYHLDEPSSMYTGGAARVTLGNNRMDMDLRWLIVIATR